MSYKFKLAFILLACIVSFTICSFAQTISQEEKQKIILQLDSNNVIARYDAIQKIMSYNILEAVPTINSKVFNESGILQYEYMKALVQFDAENVDSIALSIIESAGEISQRQIEILDLLQIKLRATDILFRIGNYSTTPYLFQYLRSPGSFVEFLTIGMLDSLIQNETIYEDSAKFYLLQTFQNDSDSYNKYIMLATLVKHFGQEMLPIVLNTFLTDTVNGGNIRFHTLEYLFGLNYYDLHSLLSNQISKDPSLTLRVEIAESLLTHYGTIQDFYSVLSSISVKSSSIIDAYIYWVIA
ncbi:MAG: hypothetical protein HYZ34_10435 [Ignavibacteriae bacterium]|nr:hypothetical protein [Ignavibacteriota bacterium]